MVLATPALWAEPAQCSGAAEINPPFEMGGGNFGGRINERILETVFPENKT